MGLVVFKPLNTKIEKRTYDITIQNMDISSEHLGNEKAIVAYLDEVENLLLDKDTFNCNIVLHALKLVKNELRIEKVQFYRVPEENKLILLVVSDIRKFGEPELFSRHMSIAFKREKFVFSVVEILTEDWELIKKGERTVPPNWQLDEALTARFDKMKHYNF